MSVCLGGSAHVSAKTCIVTSTYRYKRPRRSAIITVRDRRTVQRQREQQQMAKALAGGEPRRSAIVTARKLEKAIPDGWLPDTPEEHKRRGDAADALFQEMKREIVGDA